MNKSSKDFIIELGERYAITALSELKKFEPAEKKDIVSIEDKISSEISILNDKLKVASQEIKTVLDKESQQLKIKFQNDTEPINNKKKAEITDIEHIMKQNKASYINNRDIEIAPLKEKIAAINEIDKLMPDKKGYGDILVDGAIHGLSAGKIATSWDEASKKPYEKEIERVKQFCKNEIERVNAPHKQRIKIIKDIADNEIKDIKRLYKESLSQKEDICSQTVERLTTECKEKSEELNIYLESKITEIKKNYTDKFLAILNENKNELIEKFVKQIMRLKSLDDKDEKYTKLMKLISDVEAFMEINLIEEDYLIEQLENIFDINEMQELVVPFTRVYEENRKIFTTFSDLSKKVETTALSLKNSMSKVDTQYIGLDISCSEGSRTTIQNHIALYEDFIVNHKAASKRVGEDLKDITHYLEAKEKSLFIEMKTISDDITNCEKGKTNFIYLQLQEKYTHKSLYEFIQKIYKSSNFYLISNYLKESYFCEAIRKNTNLQNYNKAIELHSYLYRFNASCKSLDIQKLRKLVRGEKSKLILKKLAKISAAILFVVAIVFGYQFNEKMTQENELKEKSTAEYMKAFFKDDSKDFISDSFNHYNEDAFKALYYSNFITELNKKEILKYIDQELHNPKTAKNLCSTIVLADHQYKNFQMIDKESILKEFKKSCEEGVHKKLSTIAVDPDRDIKGILSRKKGLEKYEKELKGFTAKLNAVKGKTDKDSRLKEAAYTLKILDLENSILWRVNTTFYKNRQSFNKYKELYRRNFEKIDSNYEKMIALDKKFRPFYAKNTTYYKSNMKKEYKLYFFLSGITIENDIKNFKKDSKEYIKTIEPYVEKYKELS